MTTMTTKYTMRVTNSTLMAKARETRIAIELDEGLPMERHFCTLIFRIISCDEAIAHASRIVELLNAHPGGPLYDTTLDRDQR